MAFIRTISEEQADGLVQDQYQDAYRDVVDGEVSEPPEELPSGK